MYIRIKFDNPRCEYYPGTVLSGNMYLYVQKPKYIRKIAITIKGKIKNRFKKGRSSCVGIQNIFIHNIICFEKPKKIQLQPGRYKYHFEYLLPENLPINWKGPSGCIRYTVKVLIDIPLGFDISRKEEFKIIPVVDLNVIPQARERFLINIQKPLGFFCCPSGSVTLIVSAPRSGYICSETIPLVLDIRNNSDYEVYQTEINICKKIIYLSTAPRNRKIKELITLVSGRWPTNILPYGGRQIFQTPLQLKPTEPSTINDALITKIIYEVKVKCIINGFNSNISEKSLIIIGNVPLNN